MTKSVWGTPWHLAEVSEVVSVGAHLTSVQRPNHAEVFGEGNMVPFGLATQEVAAPVDPRTIEKPKMTKAKRMRVKGQAVVVEPEMLWALESIFPALAAKHDRRVAAVRGAHTL